MEGATTLISEVGTVFTQILDWMGEFLTSLVGGELAPLLGIFGLGIAIALFRALVGLVRNLTWGA